MLMVKLIFFPLIFFKMSCPEKLYETIIVQETPQYICALECVLECVIDNSLVSLKKTKREKCEREKTISLKHSQYFYVLN